MLLDTAPTDLDIEAGIIDAKGSNCRRRQCVRRLPRQAHHRILPFLGHLVQQQRGSENSSHDLQQLVYSTIVKRRHQCRPHKTQKHDEH